MTTSAVPEPFTPSPAGHSCAGCVFYAASATECRASAPVASPNGQAVWPIVKADDWCGAWRNVEWKP